MKVFLTAKWQNLINLTYRVPSEKLLPFVPKGLELDLYEGHAHVSLVAFDFVGTKVKNVKIPFHVDFPEINLRFYVKSGDKRGVVFIKELVPKHCIAFIAKRFYNEPYASFPMECKVEDLENGDRKITHKLWKDKNRFEIQVTAGPEIETPGPDSVAHFFKEHDIGFGTDHKDNTICYAVSHPIWQTRPLTSWKLKFDFAEVYGAEWAFLNEMEPTFPVFALGSAIKVYHPFPLSDGIPSFEDLN